MGEPSSVETKKSLPIFLLGCGGVALQLISHILTTRSFHAAQGLHISFKGICDSNSLILSEPWQHAELNDISLSQIQITKASKIPLSSLPLSDNYTIKTWQSDSRTNDVVLNMKEFQSCNGGSCSLIVVDCTASDETAMFLARAADLGHCIVLANKKPLTSSLGLYDRLCKRSRYLRYESTVGAGLPVIATVMRFLMAGDPVHQIVGALSGTLGYVMHSLEQGQPFSKVVQKAKSLGYTEPDPRDDLSGMDVARKALILTRLLGWSINMEDVVVESLFPTHMEQNKMSIEEFLKGGLVSLDGKMNDCVNSAKARGNVMRYVATMGNGSCKVGMVEVSEGSPLGQLKGSDNLIQIHSRCYNNSPFVMQGAGAGNDTTACGVLADILDLQDLF